MIVVLSKRRKEWITRCAYYLTTWWNLRVRLSDAGSIFASLSLLLSTFVPLPWDLT